MSDGPTVVRSVAGLGREHGRLAVSVGVFDGLHLGHAHLLAALVRCARAWAARPAVITFDAHPDAVLRGEAPPLLLDPADREQLLARAGVEVIVVEHFDDRLRMTPYDEFVAAIQARVDLAGFVMSEDAAFGHERRGTPEALRALAGASRSAFEVAVVAPFIVDGRPVSSSDIRRLVASGNLAAVERLLGRPYAVVGRSDRGSGRVSFPLPVALPPRGEYRVTVGAVTVVARIDDRGSVAVDGPTASAGERVRLVFEAQSPPTARRPASVGTKPQRS
jgi:FAD synthase